LPYIIASPESNEIQMRQAVFNKKTHFVMISIENPPVLIFKARRKTRRKPSKTAQDVAQGRKTQDKAQAKQGASKAQAKPRQGARRKQGARHGARRRKGASKGARQASQDKPRQASQGRTQDKQGARRHESQAKQARAQGGRKNGAPLTARP